MKLKPGQAGYITQALGGSFTVYVEGNLFRIAGEDADAIGKEPVQAAGAAAERRPRTTSASSPGSRCAPATTRRSRSTSSTSAWCTSARSTPNEDGTRTVEVKMTLTAPGCGMGDILVDDVRDKIQRIPTVRDAKVELTFDPPWNQTHDVRGGAPADGHVLKGPMA